MNDIQYDKEIEDVADGTNIKSTKTRYIGC